MIFILPWIIISAIGLYLYAKTGIKLIRLSKERYPELSQGLPNDPFVGVNEPFWTKRTRSIMKLIFANKYPDPDIQALQRKVKIIYISIIIFGVLYIPVLFFTAGLILYFSSK